MSKGQKRGWRIYNPKQLRRLGRFWQREDKVKDTKTAFFYLLDNVSGENSGKLLSDHASRGDYHWIERSRGAEQYYFVVRRRGNHIVVTRRKWVVDDQSVNLFLGSLLGFEKEPILVEDVILRHPIRLWKDFERAYRDVSPELEWWD